MTVRFASLTSAAVLVLGLPAAASAQSRCEGARVLLTVDKSSSMVADLPGGTTKWRAARMAIGELTGSFADRVEFGLQPFPDSGRCVPGTVTMDVGERSSDALLDALGEAPPEGGNYTPMAETLDVAAEYAPLRDPARDNHLILITDGWQYCYPHDPKTRFAPVEAVERLRKFGITVHVVGFGAKVDALTLNRAAVAAGTDLPGCDPDGDEPDDPDPCYLQADDLSELSGVLDGIGRYITDEACDGFDNDCDARTDEGYDRDGDGFTLCGGVPGSPGETDPSLADCDEDDESVHPGAEEACDRIDNDCDGEVDEDAHCGRRRICRYGQCIHVVPDGPLETPPVRQGATDAGTTRAAPIEGGGCRCAGAGTSGDGPATPVTPAAVLAAWILVAVRERWRTRRTGWRTASGSAPPLS